MSKAATKRLRAGLYELPSGLWVEYRPDLDQWEVTDPSVFHDPHRGLYPTKAAAVAAHEETM